MSHHNKINQCPQENYGIELHDHQIQAINHLKTFIVI